MSRIVTITFNPCVDKSTTIPELIPEKKLHCSAPMFEPGGGGINVSRAIKKLGGESTAIFPAGGYSGKFLKTLLDRENINSIMVETGSHTRENLIVVDTSSNAQYRFGMPGSKLTETEWMACVSEIEKINDVNYIVASGSLPPQVPAEVFGQVAEIGKKIEAKVIIDTSGEALHLALKRGVYLIKPNLNELYSLVGKKELRKEEIIDEARKIITRGDCQVFVVTLGAEGALLITTDKAVQFKPPKVDKKSTVGAGDSTVAGITYTLQKGKSLEEAVQFGVSCGTAATKNSGTELCHLQDVETLFPLVTIVPYT